MLFFDTVFHTPLFFGHDFSDLLTPISQLVMAFMFLWMGYGLIVAKKHGYFIRRYREDVRGNIAFMILIVLPAWMWIFLSPLPHVALALMFVVFTVVAIDYYVSRSVWAHVTCPLDIASFRKLCESTLKKLSVEFEETVAGFDLYSCRSSLTIAGVGGAYRVQMHGTIDRNLFDRVIDSIELQMQQREMSGAIPAMKTVFFFGLFLSLFAFTTFTIALSGLTGDAPDIGAYERREIIRIAARDQTGLAVETLTNALDDQSCVVQKEAAILIGELGVRAESATNALRAKVNGEKSCVSMAAKHALELISLN